MKWNISEMLNGQRLFEDPQLNKDTAFSAGERKKYHLEGLLPEIIESIDDQVKRVNMHLGIKPNDLERYIYLISLQERNETLFFKVLMSDPAKFVPIVYDPTVGEACLKFSHIYRQKAGMYVTIKDKGRVKEILENWPVKDVRFICVSTGGRILGLGDLGANGMGIPIGKLQLYTACAAIPPEPLLPLLLDCGTDNEDLLKDPFYIGLRQHRPSTTELDEFVAEFVEAVQEVFPKCCIHFEDWKGTDAIRLLKKYRNEVLCYNDDIQGTGAVALAGLIGALRISNKKLTDQRILFFGAGSAGIGIANMIGAAMQLDGLAENQMRDQIALFDVNGLLADARTDMSDEQIVYSKQLPLTRDLVTAIEEFKPTVIIGVSTVGKSFTQNVIEAMSKISERPIVFALSNPTDHAECTAEEAYKWSNGQAIYAAGVQFDTVNFKGKTFYPGQANNFYLFPAVSLAIYATQPKHVTDEMWIEAAKALANLVSPDELSKGMVFPPQENILELSAAVAAHVASVVFDCRLTDYLQPADIKSWISDMQFQPVYQ